MTSEVRDLTPLLARKSYGDIMFNFDVITISGKSRIIYEFSEMFSPHMSMLGDGFNVDVKNSIEFSKNNYSFGIATNYLEELCLSVKYNGKRIAYITTGCNIKVSYDGHVIKFTNDRHSVEYEL